MPPAMEPTRASMAPRLLPPAFATPSAPGEEFEQLAERCQSKQDDDGCPADRDR